VQLSLLNCVDIVFHMPILLCISSLPENLCDTKSEILLQDYSFDFIHQYPQIARVILWEMCIPRGNETTVEMFMISEV